MTQKIKTFREKIAEFRANKKIKERQKELQKAKECILYNLTNNLSTEESIDMFNEVAETFCDLKAKRLERITEEKTNLENFLQ